MFVLVLPHSHYAPSYNLMYCPSSSVVAETVWIKSLLVFLFSSGDVI